jgi:hypothetical protein
MRLVVWVWGKTEKSGKQCNDPEFWSTYTRVVWESAIVAHILGCIVKTSQRSEKPEKPKVDRPQACAGFTPQWLRQLLLNGSSRCEKVHNETDVMRWFSAP